MKRFKNPFQYGGKVTGGNFWDREAEIRELLEDIRSRQHVIVFSQRRLGKTSLVHKVLEEATKHGIVGVYVDLYPISGLEEFIEEYARSIARALSPYEKTKKLMRELFSRLHLTMGIDPAGNPQWSVGFDRSQEAETFEEVIWALEHYLARKRRYGVVVFDEFQQIIETDGEKTERRLRSAIQAQRRVCYMFVGSKKHLLSDLFSNPNRPFYRSGKIFPLGRMPSDELRRIIKKKFAGVKVGLETSALEKIIQVTECHPYYTQYLCHILYDIIEGQRIQPEDVALAVDFLLRREASAYINTWDLLTRRQRQALVILAQTAPGENPFRSEALRKFKITQPSVMVRALKSLIQKDIVDKEEGRYEILDLFFKRWIRKYISQSQML
ncbi:MAG: ATP-binding protein [Deltaproteobacteria bacterium]|nr:ATP-binding protein [Deltaproteobacteria bacterium]